MNSHIVSGAHKYVATDIRVGHSLGSDMNFHNLRMDARPLYDESFHPNDLDMNLDYT